MNKTKIILICIFVLALVSILTYFNYDRILDYFTNREWEIAGSIGKIELDSYLDICGTNSNFIVVGNNSLKGYTDDARLGFDENIHLKNAVTYTCADYLIVAEKDSSNVYVVCENEIKWSVDLGNANILAAYINKNGYAAVIYEQAGYKTLIKVFSSTGDELFTNYLASTYAIDVAISNNNKTLAIAEIDTNGVTVDSNIKLIDIGSIAENKVEKYELDSNELITDIEYSEDNELIIMTDLAVKIFKNGSIEKVFDHKTENILMADITNKKNIVAIKVEEDGIFSSKSYICIYDLKDSNNISKYELKDMPSKISCLKNIIAVDMGDEVIFINTSGNFVKKCEYKGQLKEINLMKDGDIAVLIFRNTAELVKVGGL